MSAIRLRFQPRPPPSFGLCRHAHNVTRAVALTVSSTTPAKTWARSATSSSKSRPFGVENVFPTFYSRNAQNPPLVIRAGRAVGAAAPPADLSFLRPPPFEFVPPPPTDLQGRATLGARVGYLLRRCKAWSNFYREVLRRDGERRVETRRVSRLLRSLPNDRHVGKYFLWGGSQSTPEYARFPVLTRKDHQVLASGREAALPLTYLFPLLVPGYLVRLILSLLRIHLSPPPWRRPDERIRHLKGMIRRYDLLQRQWFNDYDQVVKTSQPDSRQDPRVREAAARHWLRHDQLWSYVLGASFFSRFAPWVSYYLTEKVFHRFFRVLSPDARLYHNVVIDTVLIMREGGFARLSAEDIYEYCIKCASPTFLELARQALANGVDPINESIKRRMVPILEKRANAMLNIDWTRVNIPVLWALEPFNRLYDLSPDSVRWVLHVDSRW